MRDATERRRRWADITLCAGGALVALWLFGEALWWMVLPFLLAGALALAVRPAGVLLARRTGAPAGAFSVALALLLGVGLSLGLWAVLRQLLGEAVTLLEGLAEGDAPGAFFAQLSQMLASIPLVGRWLPTEEGALESLVASWARGWLAQLPGAVTAWLAALPGGMLTALVFLLSAFYFCVDYDRIGALVRRVLPQGWWQRLQRVRGELLHTAWVYLRVYLLLTAITFTLLLLGFSLLRLPYALLLSVVLSVLDLLPVIGVGTFLLPAAVVVMVMGNVGKGVGLLALYIVILLVRQLVEARLVGRKMGMHPLPVLMCMYAGMRLGGVWGMLVAPPAALVGYSLLAAGRAGKEPGAFAAMGGGATGAAGTAGAGEKGKAPPG